jgi:hypothetical protein
MGIVGSGGAAPFSFGNALQFDGVDDYVSMTPITESNTWFLSFWITNFVYNGAYIYLFGFDAASGSRGGIGMSLGGTAIGLSFGDLFYYNGASLYALNVNINPSSWSHVAINATPTGLEISLNGGASVTTVLPVPSNSLNEIGTLDLSQFGQIIFDEIGFLSGSNGTTQNITDLYNGGNGESFTTVMGANNLNLHLNESGTDRIAIDSGGSGNDGTLNNFPTSGMWVVNRAGQTPTVMYPDWDVVEANITVSGGGTATNKILRTGAGGYQGALDSLMGLDDFVFDYIVGSVNENYKFLGLSNQNIQAQSMDMLFGFFLVTINDVRIRENLSDRHYFTVIQGDKMTIQRVGGTIYYYLNNVLIFNSTLVNGNEVYPIGLPGDPNVFVEGIKITGFIYGS